MPQTEEHVQILEYLGVTRAVVALTKSDRATGGVETAVAGVRARLEEIEREHGEAFARWEALENQRAAAAN